MKRGRCKWCQHFIFGSPFLQFFFSDSNLPCGNICNPLLFTCKGIFSFSPGWFHSAAITLKRAFKICAHISKAQTEQQRKMIGKKKKRGQTSGQEHTQTAHSKMGAISSCQEMSDFKETAVLFCTWHFFFKIEGHLFVVLISPCVFFVHAPRKRRSLFKPHI